MRCCRWTMARPSKEPAKETVADLLADLARVYGLEPVRPDEITVEMMLEQGLVNNRMTATRILYKAVADGVLAPPVHRNGKHARRVLAWRRLK